MRIRDAWPVLLLGLGLALAAVWVVVEPTLYRAQATVVVDRAGRPVPSVSKTVAALVTSNVLLQNVADRLAVRGGAGALREHVHVKPSAGSLRLSYDAGSGTDAVRVLQQLTVELGAELKARFGLDAVVFDPAHETRRVSPHTARDLAIGALVGGAAAVAAAAGRMRRRPHDDRYRLSRLRAATARAHADEEQRETWRAYVGVLAAQADGDFIPHTLDSVVREVFGSVLGES